MHIKDPDRSRLTYPLAAALLVAIVVAYTSVGASTSQTSTATRTSTARSGVVQSTVSGSGKVEPSSELDLGFKTSGTVTNIYVTRGEHVRKGQLIAALVPTSAEVTLEQARASLQAAEATLAQEEEDGGETSGSGTGGGSAGASTGAAKASSSNVDAALITHRAAPTEAMYQSATASARPVARIGSTVTSAATSTVAVASPVTTTQVTRSQASSSSATQSEATRAANLASARAAVRSDKLTVLSDARSVENTRLYAPESGTIVTLAGEIGEDVSVGGTTRVSTAEGGSSSKSSGAAAASGAAGGGASASSSASGSSGSSSGSSSSAFAVLSDLSSMQLVVSFSESEIGNVKVGQTATVSIEALNGAKLSAHVVEVATLPSSSSSSVVSYDVTFELDQLEAGLKPGMSATAEVVVEQAEGVSVPTSAISGGSVTVLEAGKQVRRSVTTGLVGNSSTLIVSGLKAGETVVLPQTTGSASSTGSLRSSTRSSSSSGSSGGTLGGSSFPGGGFSGGGPPGG